ncbi:hypothetical protein IEQ34_012965 [Dendrobium chrysotoxum]|uniref:Uncharacterized protein n=1 Tax=Dendrobium chrysotoxum TaxID=161865 RepID=A0AAV7G712_DENCH|nr:hypothetical protein IEQ34_012965 [Dendrobium chrysotoxum]
MVAFSRPNENNLLRLGRWEAKHPMGIPKLAQISYTDCGSAMTVSGFYVVIPMAISGKPHWNTLLPSATPLFSKILNVSFHTLLVSHTSSNTINSLFPFTGGFANPSHSNDGIYKRVVTVIHFGQQLDQAPSIIFRRSSTPIRCLDATFLKKERLTGKQKRTSVDEDELELSSSLLMLSRLLSLRAPYSSSRSSMSYIAWLIWLSHRFGESSSIVLEIALKPFKGVLKCLHIVYQA